MRLLIVTQKMDINDPILGFFHRWVEEFAKHFKSITVICLYEGEHTLPTNVRVLSLGKENGASRFKYLVRFYKYIWNERKNYDGVFVHMNQVYIILGGVLWRIWGKKIALWYAHGKVSLSLKIAEKIADSILTSTIDGFKIKTPKLFLVGQGIDTSYFVPLKDSLEKKNAKNTIITVGRLSPVKDYETIIKAVELLKKENFFVNLKIVGGSIAQDQTTYEKEIIDLVNKKNLSDRVFFEGPVPQSKLLPHLQNATLFVNMSHTGSLDKAILEAMAVGIPVLTCNGAAASFLRKIDERLVVQEKNSQDLARRIKQILEIPQNEIEHIKSTLREEVARNHSLKKFAVEINKTMVQYYE